MKTGHELSIPGRHEARALADACDNGTVEVSARTGRGGGRLYTVSAPKRAEVRRRASEKCATAPIGGALTAQYQDQGSAPPRSASPTGCTGCGQPLDPSLASFGETTHPSCDPEGNPR